METRILYNKEADCCGCGACMNVCPKHAIHMRENKLGFVYPVIDEEKCINCGLCQGVCGYQHFSVTQTPLQTYVASSKKDDIITSASGGVFFNIAYNVLKTNGIVYGASLERQDDQLFPMHIAVESEEELIKLQGSKYVQSSIGYVYVNIRKQLKEGRTVLFSGTPCQVDGLYHFLKNTNIENLFTIDIICHGVPSAKWFQDYLQILQTKVSGKINHIVFRDKTKGWGYFGRIDYMSHGKQKSKTLYPGESSYYNLFLNSAICRENCYSCKYACDKRPGDITIGDYWGIEKEHPEYLNTAGGDFDIQRGISCLIVNNDQGKKMLEKFGDGLLLFESSFEKVSFHNEQLSHPSNRYIYRNEVLDLYQKAGYVAVEKWFNKKLGRKKWITIIRNRMPKKFERAIKRILKK